MNQVEIIARTMLYKLKIRATHKSSGQIRLRLVGTLRFALNRMRKNVYPITPHTGTGNPKNTEYGLWDTVSQLIEREMAQKLS